MKKLLLYVLAISCIGQSCTKEPETPVPTERGARITLMNACLGSGEISAEVTSTSRELRHKLNYLSISGYYVLKPDSYKFSFFTFPIHSQLATGQTTLEYEKRYIAMVIGQVGKARLLIAENKQDKPAAGKANVRFINASPDSCTVDVMIASSSLFEDINYKNVTDYKEVNAGNVTLSARKNADGVDMTQSNFTLEEQKNYTILLLGTKNGNEQEALHLMITTY